MAVGRIRVAQHPRLHHHERSTDRHLRLTVYHYRMDTIGGYTGGKRPDGQPPVPRLFLHGAVSQCSGQCDTTGWQAAPGEVRSCPGCSRKWIAEDAGPLDIKWTPYAVIQERVLRRRLHATETTVYVRELHERGYWVIKKPAWLAAFTGPPPAR